MPPVRPRPPAPPAAAMGRARPVAVAAASAAAIAVAKVVAAVAACVSVTAARSSERFIWPKRTKPIARRCFSTLAAKVSIVSNCRVISRSVGDALFSMVKMAPTEYVSNNATPSKCMRRSGFLIHPPGRRRRQAQYDLEPRLVELAAERYKQAAGASQVVGECRH